MILSNSLTVNRCFDSTTVHQDNARELQQKLKRHRLLLCLNQRDIRMMGKSSKNSRNALWPDGR